MKLKMKLMAAAVALGVVSAGAQAAIQPTSSATGNGELFMTVYDAGATAALSDDRSYVRDLGNLTNASANAGGLISNWAGNASPFTLTANKLTSPDPIYSVAADSNLTSFIAGTDDKSRLRWNLVAVDNINARRVLTTADTLAAQGNTPFRTLVDNRIISYINNVNSASIPDSGSLVRTGAGADLAGWGATLGGGLTGNSADVLGGSLGFFMLAESASTGAATMTQKQYIAAANPQNRMEWTLANDGGLTYAAAIPEPETYALLLAGLGMLGFIARRRMSNHA